MPPSSLPKLFLISVISSIIISAAFFTQTYCLCLDNQKSLLRELKNELIFNSSISEKLVQWNQTDEDDCCDWYAVECDGFGHVISLQLDHEAISGGIENSSSLFRLKYLEKLNLAYNSFNYTQIPRAIENLSYLTHLNLSNATFGGQVPLQLSLLRRLVSLDTSNSYYWETELLGDALKLEYPSLEILVQNLTQLRELYLDGAIFPDDERTEWSRIVSSYLPNLTSLSLCNCNLSGPIHSSFSQLHSLSILRLDSNHYLSTNVPNFFANFSSLTTLSLAACDLKGYFPTKIFHIPTLQNLDLSANDLLSGSIPPFTQSGSLNSVVLRWTNFSGSIPTSIGNLKTLSHIDLSYCKFTGSIPSTFANLTKLIHVDLSYNFFTGSIPSSLANLTKLTHVVLSFNIFTGSLPSTLFGGLSNLVYLNLECNSFSGNIPHYLFGLPSLLEVQLRKNKFSGQVEEFPIVNASKMVHLDLSGNQLEGPIPESFFQLQSLRSLSLSENLFSGTFELEKIQSFPNLTFLDLSRNNLSVVVSNDNSSSDGNPQLIELYLTYCNLNDFPDFLKHSGDITKLDLSNNQIVGEIPSWIWGRKLEHLDLSHNLLTDLQKPYHIPPSLYSLYLHSNQLWEPIPLIVGNLTSQLGVLSLANNSLSGSIPTSLCNATSLNFLHLSDNKLSGNIPPCLLQNIDYPGWFDLSRNNISGSIPDYNFSEYCSLQYFDISNNTIEGKIPNFLKKCWGLEFMNVGNNIIKDSFPCMLSSTELRVLVLRSNRFHGEVKCQESWPNLQVLDISSNNFRGSLESINFSSWRAMMLETDAQFNKDFPLSFGMALIIKGIGAELVKLRQDFTSVDFSCNNFVGEIPNAIGDLTFLRLLNLSQNALNGSIPKSFGKLRKLESLDLSQNQLRGTIPIEIAGLTFLSVLNLSYNKLVGKIPNGRQLQTFSADSFKENAGLCGFPLNISCSNITDDNDLSPPEHENVHRKREIEWEYVSAALGYVVGLGSVVWLLLICRSFREKYFGKIEEVVEEIFESRDRRRRRARRVVRRTQVRRQ